MCFYFSVKVPVGLIHLQFGRCLKEVYYPGINTWRDILHLLPTLCPQTIIPSLQMVSSHSKFLHLSSGKRVSILQSFYIIHESLHHL